MSSALAPVSGVWDTSSGVCASTAPTRTVVSVASSIAVQSSAASLAGLGSSADCATHLSGVGIAAGVRVPVASAPVVAVVRLGPFLSGASSANISADAHVGVARVGVVPQVSAVSSVSDVSVGVCAGPVSSQAA